MALEPWHKIVTPRQEVREGRSFNPDEFAIHLDQVAGGNAPEDYARPEKFFARNWFTRALTEHAGLVLRRLSGETANTAPVLSLVTQFGGGKTHTLTTLYHLARRGPAAAEYPGVARLLHDAHLATVPQARVAVFVGNAWDPQDGLETPWLDLAWQLAGEQGIAALGPSARTSPPGTTALNALFQAADGTVLILFDEVLNFVNRHRPMADHLYAFLQNLTTAVTGTSRCAAVISLPRSQVEMTAEDLVWQERITKVVRRVAKDLIANDEAEIGEVVRRRLFEDLGEPYTRRRVAEAFAAWCFERRAQLPPEWTAVDTATTEATARDLLRARFEACYPFHPATLSVFQRKWQSLPQYQQTRGTLAMLAQWISWAQKNAYTQARQEPFITLGSAPLDQRDFRAVVLGQLGEARLAAAIDADIASPLARAKALDADLEGSLRNLHQRVGTALFFESSGGQLKQVAHLPELRFALGEPGLDTTSIDNAALSLEDKAFYIRRVGSDGFQIHAKEKLNKVVSDRRASLDARRDVLPEVQKLIRAEFDRGRSVPALYFPPNGDEVGNSPRLTLVVLDPSRPWNGGTELRVQLAEWTRQKGGSPRLYPAALVWCLCKPGRDLLNRVEEWLAWRQVQKEVEQGTLGRELERGELQDLHARVKEAHDDAKDEVWASYRFVVLADGGEPDKLRVIDLSAGHASGSETLAGRILAALKAHGLLNESVGAGYVDRHWPDTFAAAGAWPLDSLRQSFLNGALTRLLDPETVLRGKIVDFVVGGDFGLASGPLPGGSYQRVWYKEPISPDEVSFESGVLLLRKAQAEEWKRRLAAPQPSTPAGGPGHLGTVSPIEAGSSDQPVQPEPPTVTTPGPTVSAEMQTLRLSGSVPPEVWNRLGTKLIPKLRAGSDVQIDVEFRVSVPVAQGTGLEADLRQILGDLDLRERVRIEKQ